MEKGALPPGQRQQAERITMAADADSRTLDVTAFFEKAGITRFHVWLLVISSFVTQFDGLDFSLISFTLPYLRDELHLNDAIMGVVS
jgi:AAHS family 4-hydroxybenzoate transporter-like MFS transporter